MEIVNPNFISNEIPILFDLTKDSQFIQEDIKLSDSIFVDSNNNLFVPTQQNIYILSLKKRAVNKNWIKHLIQMPSLIKDFKAKINQDYFYQDKYTFIFNNENSQDKNKDGIDFLNYSTSKEFSFNSDIFRNRLVYLNSFDHFSLKITKFLISSIGLTRRNKPILSVLMSNSECYLMSFHDEKAIKGYQIEVCINEYLIKNKKITTTDELLSISWSNVLESEKGDQMQLFIAHFPSKIFSWEISKNERESSMNMNFYCEINLNEFPYKSSHIFIESCSHNSNLLFLSIFSQKKKILFLEFNRNEKMCCKQTMIETDLYSFEIIKKYEPRNPNNEQNCNCVILVASNSKIFEITLKDNKITEFFSINEPIHFTSILQQDEKLIFSTINNKIYFYYLNQNVKNENNQINFYSFKTLANLKSLIFSRNHLLKIAIGSAHKQKKSATNIVILTNIKSEISSEEILIKMIISFKNKIFENLTLKEPLNFDDLLCILAENHNIFVELVAIIKTLMEEQNSLDNFTKIKKFSINKQNLINTKKKINEIITNKETLNFILGRLFFTILMIHREDFDIFINDAKIKFLKSFYKNIFCKNFKETENKVFLEESTKNFLRTMKTNLEVYLDDNLNMSMDIEKFCKICKKFGKCDYNHSFMKCILSQEDIYLEKLFVCSYCHSAMIDIEHEFKIKTEVFDFNYNICPLCLHLLKRPLCEI